MVMLLIGVHRIQTSYMLEWQIVVCLMVEVFQSGGLSESQWKRQAQAKSNKPPDKSSKPLDKITKATKPSSVVRCVCSSLVDSGHMVECKRCSAWSHCKCIGISATLAPTYPFVCPFCVKSVLSQLDNLRSEVSDLCARMSNIEQSIEKAIPSPVQAELQHINKSLSTITTQLDPSARQMAMW